MLTHLSIAGVHDWITGHPVFTILFTFIASLLVSIWGSDIRTFLRVWPAEKLGNAANRKISSRFKDLEWINGSSFRLLVYIILVIKSVVIAALSWATILFICEIVWKGFWHIPLLPVVFGIAVPRLMEIAELCELSTDYEASRAKLRADLGMGQ